jgi:hypothetical protein
MKKRGKNLEKLKIIIHSIVAEEALDAIHRDHNYLFSRLFQKGGLTHLKDVVRDIERSDVACREYPRFKPHDDIAAISLSF